MEFLELRIPHVWLWLAGSFLLCIVLTVVGGRLTKHFRYRRGTAVTKFSMMDLEFPGSPAAISNIVNGMDLLKGDAGARSRSALRSALLLDFLFMAALFPAIFLLCMQMSLKMEFIGRYFFLVLAWLQVIALLCDIIENLYLLRKISRPFPAQPGMHRAYRAIVSTKWVIATLGIVCGLSAMVYFWIQGNYSDSFLLTGKILLAAIGLALLFMIYRTVRAIFNNEAEKEALQPA